MTEPAIPQGETKPAGVIKDAWRKFDTPLKRRADVDFEKLSETNEHGMRLAQVKPEIKSDALREILRGQKVKARK